MTKWLNLREAAQYLGIHRNTLRYLVREKRIKAYRVPGMARSLRFLIEDLDSALSSGAITLA